MDADYIDLALDLVPLFEGFGPDLLRKLVGHIVQAERDTHVHFHSVSDPRARPRAYKPSTRNVAPFFNNAFLVKRVKWWSHLFANVLSLRSTFLSLEEHERNFWVHFNLVVGTLKKDETFFISSEVPGPHFVGEWMRFRAPLVPASLYHLDGVMHQHNYHPLSMPSFEFYAHFPKEILSIERALDHWASEIDVVNVPAGDAGGPGVPFTSITSRYREKGSDEYKLEKRIVVWKKQFKLIAGSTSTKPEWVIDREIGKGLVNDFNSNEASD